MTALRRAASVSVPDFDALYAADADPWRVASSWYERRKRAVLLASLPAERYARAWEPGCGTGITTRALAQRCAVLIASDPSEVAVGLAAEECAGLSNVGVERRRLPATLDGPPADLIVVAEFLYYLEDRAAALDAIWSSAAPGAHLAFVHWRSHPHDAYVSGDALHDAIAEDAAHRGCRALVRYVDVDFRLDIYEAP